jgi:hypothetical protein
MQGFGNYRGKGQNIRREGALNFEGVKHLLLQLSETKRKAERLVCRKRLNTKQYVFYWKVLTFTIAREAKIFANSDLKVDVNGKIKLTQYYTYTRLQENRTGDIYFHEEKRSDCGISVGLLKSMCG